MDAGDRAFRFSALLSSCSELGGVDAVPGLVLLRVVLDGELGGVAQAVRGLAPSCEVLGSRCLVLFCVELGGDEEARSLLLLQG